MNTITTPSDNNSCKARKGTPYPSPDTLAHAPMKHKMQSPLVLGPRNSKRRPLPLTLPPQALTGASPTVSPTPCTPCAPKRVLLFSPGRISLDEYRKDIDDKLICDKKSLLSKVVRSYPKSLLSKTKEKEVASHPRPIPGKLRRTSATLSGRDRAETRPENPGSSQRGAYGKHEAYETRHAVPSSSY